MVAQCMGLNTCWAGTFQKYGAPADIGAGKHFAIDIAIGYDENQGRQRISKTPEQVPMHRAPSRIGSISAWRWLFAPQQSLIIRALISGSTRTATWTL